MDYRIIYVVIYIIGEIHADVCPVYYDETSCSYTEICNGYTMYQYAQWETFINHNNYDPNSSFNTKCFILLHDHGYWVYPVNLVLQHVKSDMFSPMPPTDDYNNEHELGLIYSLDLSFNNYNQMPTIKSMANLAKLNMSNNNLSLAKLSNQDVLSGLEEIDLSNNEISNIIVQSDEHPYEKLKIINLSHNYLKRLPDNIFAIFDSLQVLDLSYNNIDMLSLTTFENVKHMVDLNLANNRLVGTNTSLFRFNELKMLNLSGNMIKDLKIMEFEHLSKLETLDLSYNMIECIRGDVFNTMVLLKRIYLNNNQLTVLDVNQFFRLQYLTTIDLSKNKLKYLPKKLFENKSITYFSIEDNKLEGSLEKGMFEGVSITKLDLSGQYLTEIKDNAFYNLGKLEILLLSSNNIQSLSERCFNYLMNLKDLDLSNNQITNIDFKKENLINLKFLSLKNNRLTEIKYENLQYFSSLQYLELSNNQIYQIEPKSFTSLINLEHLGIYNNSLLGTLKTNTFDGLVILPTLDLSQNTLTTVQNASFNAMSKLKELNMSHCNIRELEYNIFANTTAIETLDLSYNRLIQFFINTTDLVTVTTLLLNNNLIKTITSYSLRGLLELNKIDLSFNIIDKMHNESLESLVNLRKLDLSGNDKLSFSPSILNNNTHLDTLVLSGVKIQTNFSYIFEDNFISTLKLSNTGVKLLCELNLSKMAHLHFLDLMHNNISKLQVGDLSGISTLTFLDLSFNQITSVQPGVFKDNTFLYSLNISHNFLFTVGYGVFRGLIHLTILDISFNNIKDLQSELFYETENLSELIVDHNKIETVNAEEFIGTSLTKLSIGSNPIPCQTLVKLIKYNNIHFEITAIGTNDHRKENIKGIICNKGNTLQPIIKSEKELGNNDILNGLRNILLELIDRNMERTNSDNLHLEKISNILEKSNSANYEKLPKLANLTSNIIAINNNTNAMFTKTNIMLSKIINLLNKTVEITSNISLKPKAEFMPVVNAHVPLIDNDSSINNTVDVILYINKIKAEIENEIAIEKENIKRLENKLAVNDPAKYQTETLPSTISRQQLVTNEKSKSYFTEICVGMILFILLGIVLYWFYKFRMLRKYRMSSSTHELPAAMDNSTL